MIRLPARAQLTAVKRGPELAQRLSHAIGIPTPSRKAPMTRRDPDDTSQSPRITRHTSAHRDWACGPQSDVTCLRPAHSFFI
eukprot:686836-Rhodomonas_salina.1